MSKSPSLRRIQADIRELALDPSDRYHAAPLEHDMLEWHFTIRGADDTDFAGGIYHGRILLPPEYPFKPPHIVFLTKSGRFETHTKVCLSFSAFHPELWQPAWGIRLILEALISFLPTPADGALGALNWSAAERKKLARLSQNFYCPVCQCCVKDLLPELKPKAATKSSSEDGDGEDSSTKKKSSRFQKEIQELQRLQMSAHGEEAEKKAKAKEASESQDAVQESNAEDADVSTPLLMVEEKEDETTATDNKEEDTNTAKVPAEAADAVADEPSQSGGGSLANTTTATSTGENHPSAAMAQPPATTTRREQQQPPDDEPEGIVPQPDPPINRNAPPALEEEPQPALPPPPSSVHPYQHFLDPLLHGTIVVLSVLCYVLLRKIQALLDDLRALEEA